jgi:hypothetical protein
MWKLNYATKNGWEVIGAYPTGDTAKTHARQHQIGKKETYIYCITDPGANVWMVGTSKICKTGFKMKWYWVPRELDLRKAKPGDKLLSKHGIILTYIKPLPEEHLYDHEVAYIEGKGQRTNSGHVYKNPSSRLETDHDIIAILK